MSNKTSIDWKKMFEEERPNAEKAVRRSIVLDAIARQEGIEVAEEELEADFEKLAEGTQQHGGRDPGTIREGSKNSEL